MENKTVNKFQQPGKFKVVKGTILAPENAGLRFVLTVVSMAGKPEGAYFNLLHKKWPKVREELKGWFAAKGDYKMANVKELAVQSDVWVLNMLCVNDQGVLDEKALSTCLEKVCARAKYEKATVHVSNVLLNSVDGLEEALKKNLVNQGVSVNSYEDS
jgi:hypothetical protein